MTGASYGEVERGPRGAVKTHVALGLQLAPYEKGWPYASPSPANWFTR